VKKYFQASVFNLVHLHIICLNSVIEPILASKTINLQVLASTQVVNNFEVVSIVGYFSFASIKLSSSFFHS